MCVFIGGMAFVRQNRRTHRGAQRAGISTMNARVSKLSQVQPPPSWLGAAAQLLDEHHLVAWSGAEADRAAFARLLGEYLESFSDARVIRLQGSGITDIFSFCAQLQTALGLPRVRRSVEARGGVVDALRRAPESTPAIKRRFYIWHDAHVLLNQDHRLFGRLVDALAGVAAEAEYATEDLLCLHRAVFIGSPALDMYAEDRRGQFRSWLREKGEVPLWRIVTGLKRPPIARYAIEPGLLTPVTVKPRSSQRA